MTTEMCEDCPKVMHEDEIKELKDEMKSVKKGIVRLLLSIIGSVVAICAVILTGIGIADSSYQKAALINQQTSATALEIHKQQIEYQDEIDKSVNSVKDFRGILNRMENEWYARRQNEDFIMKQLYKINAKLEKENGK